MKSMVAAADVAAADVVVVDGNIAAVAAVVQFVGMNYLNAHDVEISIVIGVVVVCAVGVVAVFVPAAAAAVVVADNNCHHYEVPCCQNTDEHSPSLIAAESHC